MNENVINNNKFLIIYMFSFLVKPHLTREEYLQTQFLVNEFASGVGKDLHRKLETRAKNMRNWVLIIIIVIVFVCFFFFEAGDNWVLLNKNTCKL